MAKLINGNGNPAIYAAEDADLIASLAGNVTCIANVGNKYAATEEDATTIRLDDGVIITKEGRRIQLEAGESDTFYVPTGTSGHTNYYIIGYKLVQNADSTQVAEQFVQKMNSSSETITEDTFRSGATEVYVSVYRVTQVGFTIDSISGLLPELLDNASIKDNIDQINSDLDDNNIYTITPTNHITNMISEVVFNSATNILDITLGFTCTDNQQPQTSHDLPLALHGTYKGQIIAVCLNYTSDSTLSLLSGEIVNNRLVWNHPLNEYGVYLAIGAIYKVS